MASCHSRESGNPKQPGGPSAPGPPPSRGRRSGKLLDALDDPQIAIGSLAEDPERFLVAGAVVGRRGLLDTVEFDDHGTPEKPGLVSLGRRSARQKPPARRL